MSKLTFKDYQYLLEKRDSNLVTNLPKATAIVLSYARPRNIQWIVKALLKCDFVENVIVSNNNPLVSMRDWLDFTDDRMEIIDQTVRRRAGYRYEIAKAKKAEHYIFLDDDLFLMPDQIEYVYRQYLLKPGVPHGIQGLSIQWHGGNSMDVTACIYRVNQRVEVLNRAYFLSERHVVRVLELLKELGFSAITDLKYGDDIILSHAGDGKPFCHDVGIFYNCATSTKPGIALYAEDDFIEYRQNLYIKLQSLLIAGELKEKDE